MLDTHCHLTDPRLRSQLDAVLARATAAGVGGVITIATDLADAADAIALCRGREGVRCAIGIHPNHSHEADASHLPRLRELQACPEVVALGEMGLDYFHRYASREHQATMFRAQLALAADLGRPVVLHSREAIADTLAILREFPGVRALFHSFTGTAAEAEQIVDAGYLLGFTGPVTYKKNDDLRDAARRVPADRFVVETDAPYLSPEPVRKVKTNEPAFVAHTAARIAEVRGMSVEEVDRVTTENAKRFFGLA